MLVSFHPCVEGDMNLLCAGRDPGKKELAAIEGAEAVILPQGCRQSLYEMAKSRCRRVFPNYDARFRYPGKTGQVRLFRQAGAAHPESVIYPDVESCLTDVRMRPPLAFPLVFKFDWGGEGAGVFRFENRRGFLQFLEKRPCDPGSPCLVQTWVSGPPRALRVVRIGQKTLSYWRIARSGETFYANLTRGGTIDTAASPDLQAAGRNAVEAFCRKTGINLAGFDLLFSKEKESLFLEINYFFGRRGLGGSDRFYRILEGEIYRWLKEGG